MPEYGRGSVPYFIARREKSSRRRRLNLTDELGWGARIRTWEWRYQKPLPYRLATPQDLAETTAPCYTDTPYLCNT